MKEPAWLPVARALPFGSKHKIRCTECGTDKTLMVSHGSKGCSAYCFRASCGFTDYRAHGELSLAQLRQRQLDTEALQRSNVVALPSDSTDDLSAAARVWLLKAGVNEHLRSTYGIQYSPRYDRVILPVRKAGKLLGYTARALNGASPKYIAKFGNPADAIFMSDPRLILPDTDAPQKGSNEVSLVITEDILSAIRVGRTVQASAILGTAFTDGHLSRLLADHAGARVGVWTDGDKAGRHSSVRIRRMLMLAGCDVVNIHTERDPKLYSNREIRLCLSRSV